jgi:hypothetical protein
VAAGQAPDQEVSSDPRWRWVRAAESRREPDQRGFAPGWWPDPSPKPWEGPTRFEIAVSLIILAFGIWSGWDAVVHLVDGSGSVWWPAGWCAFYVVALCGGTVRRRREFLRWHGVLDPAMERVRSDPSALGSAWAVRVPPRRGASQEVVELTVVDGPPAGVVSEPEPVRLRLGLGRHELRFERRGRSWLLTVDVRPSDAILLLVGDVRPSVVGIDVFRIEPARGAAAP